MTQDLFEAAAFSGHAFASALTKSDAVPITSAVVETKSILGVGNFKDRTLYHQPARIKSDTKVLASNMIILAVFADKPDRRYSA